MRLNAVFPVFVHISSSWIYSLSVRFFLAWSSVSPSSASRLAIVLAGRFSACSRRTLAWQVWSSTVCNWWMLSCSSVTIFISPVRWTSNIVLFAGIWCTSRVVCSTIRIVFKLFPVCSSWYSTSTPFFSPITFISFSLPSSGHSAWCYPCRCWPPITFNIRRRRVNVSSRSKMFLKHSTVNSNDDKKIDERRRSIV